MIGCRIAIVALALWGEPARAEPPAAAGRTARTIGRAGIGTVSDDGAGALLANPAGLARRDGARLQLAVGFVDDELFWLHAASAPAARDQSSSRLVPLVALASGLGDFVLGAGAVTTTRSERLFRRPGRIPAASYGNSFEYRYAGLLGAFRRDTVVVGAARRLGETASVGFSFAGSRVATTEIRRIWAGDAGRIDRVTGAPEQPGDPGHDAELGITAVDPFVPSGVVGVLVAPADSRVELAASVAWSAPARVRGELVVGGTASVVSVVADDPSARLDLEQPLVVRTGVRWLADRWIAELGGDLWIVSEDAAAPTWRLADVEVVDITTIGVPRVAALQQLPSRISSRTHGALRGALDVELIAGFLWATGGYALATAGTAPGRLSPTFGDLGGHTFALGLEASAGAFTITLGWSRTWSVKEPSPPSAWRLDNPFGTGDGAVPIGTYDGSTDMIGVALDAELDEPE